MYYTPQTVIDYLHGQIIDPAAGTGGFLVTLARRLRDPLFSNPPFSAKPTFQNHDADDVADSATDAGANVG